ncbi:uncharacterized protein V1518DRAFT_423550 [Limtongia smithiae]|uniref:uncharacterized protein n=1 Tax=Limtongia smithiae TaxID=1125753 RepID=UPI0034CE7EDC
MAPTPFPALLPPFTPAVPAAATTPADSSPSPVSPAPSSPASPTAQPPRQPPPALSPHVPPVAFVAAAAAAAAAAAVAMEGRNTAETQSSPRPKRTSSGTVKSPSPTRIRVLRPARRTATLASEDAPSEKEEYDGQHDDSLDEDYEDELGEHGDTEEKARLQALSANLRARLSYALVKVQNGWATHSLSDLEEMAARAAVAPQLKDAVAANGGGVGANGYPMRLAPASPNQLVIDRDERGRLSTMLETSPNSVSASVARRSSSGGAGAAARQTRHRRATSDPKSYASFWSTSLPYTPPQSSHSSHSFTTDQGYRQKAYTQLQFQPPLSADPKFPVPVPIIANGPPRIAGRGNSPPRSSRGGKTHALSVSPRTRTRVPIAADGLPILGTFSNKIPVGMGGATSPSPTKRKTHHARTPLRKGGDGAAAVVAAAAAAAAELEREEAAQKVSGGSGVKQQSSEADAVESLMFLSSPTTRPRRPWAEDGVMARGKFA